MKRKATKTKKTNKITLTEAETTTQASSSSLLRY